MLARLRLEPLLIVTLKYIYREREILRMQQEQHSLGLVGTFCLFLDKLHQPYKRTKTDQTSLGVITSLQDNGEDNLVNHVEDGGG